MVIFCSTKCSNSLSGLTNIKLRLPPLLLPQSCVLSVLSAVQSIISLIKMFLLCSVIRGARSHLRVVLVPISARCVRASSLILIPSVWARILMICKPNCHQWQKRRHGLHPSPMQISDTQTHLLHLLWCVQHGADDHDSVQQVQRNPMWRTDVLCPPGEQIVILNTHILTRGKIMLLLFCVLHNDPNLIKQFPLFEANTTMGAMLLSSARWRYVKHSMSSMCTSSTNSTPGTSSATPWSI